MKKEELLKVIPIGTKVNIGADEEIEAQVASVMIRTKSNEVTYECFWWDAKQKKSDWFYPFEITEFDKNSKQPIGFFKS